MHRASVVVTLLAAAAACNAGGVKGNGQIKQETRKVGAFTAVEAGGAYTLEIAVGPQRSLALSGDSNLLALVETRVEGGTLKLRTRQSVRPSESLVVTIATPDLQRLQISGAAKGRVRQLKGQQFSVQLSGAGRLQLDGQVEQLSLNLSGAGSIDARQLKAARAKVHCSGAGKVDLFASESLDVALSGVGKVAYWGNPKQVKQNISGIGKLVKR